MSNGIRLPAYFTRIGYAGPTQPTLPVLRALHALHPRAIPFENLDPLRGERVLLDLDAIQDKLITRRRGGYCFEQNLLFAAVLTELGFDVTPLLARVRWMRADDVMTAKSHMLLRIALPEGVFIADVGFGGVTLLSPLRLEPDVVQFTEFEPARLLYAAADKHFQLELKLGSTWHTVYRFDLRPTYRIDHEVSNWYTCTHPDSHFTYNLTVCHALVDGRAMLSNDRLTVRRCDGRDSRRHLESAQELAECLSGMFGLDITGIDVDMIFERVREP
jgi:N-hydroxyarylamine O-acetyltransferase